MAYRHGVDALEARLKDLESEVGDRRRERDEVAALLAEARAHEAEAKRVADAPRRRRARRQLAIVLAVVIPMIGIVWGINHCRSRATPRSTVELFERMERWADAMCSCRDVACAQRVSDDMMKWSIEQTRSQKKAPMLSEEETRRAAQIGTRMGDCIKVALSVPED